jgi:hypothetical protein
MKKKPGKLWCNDKVNGSFPALQGNSPDLRTWGEEIGLSYTYSIILTSHQPLFKGHSSDNFTLGADG